MNSLPLFQSRHAEMRWSAYTVLRRVKTAPLLATWRIRKGEAIDVPVA